MSGPATPRSRPILFSTDMVRALLAGRKTQTRRALKRQPIDIIPMPEEPGRQWVILEQREPEPKGKIVRCRFGVPGDLLWVRETWGVDDDRYHRITYRADEGTASASTREQLEGKRWRPSIHLPRCHSRITLRITNVRAERLQDISATDCYQEGIDRPKPMALGSEKVMWDNARNAYARLWESINGAGSWNANPWVWAVSFERVESAKAAA